MCHESGEKNLKRAIICAKMHPGYIVSVNSFLRVCKKVDYALSSKIRVRPLNGGSYRRVAINELFHGDCCSRLTFCHCRCNRLKII